MTIGGEPVAGASTFQVVNPSTGEVFAHAPECTDDQLNAAMDAARDAQRSWAVDDGERRLVMEKAAAAVEAEVDHIAALLTAEQGKPRALARREVSGVATRLRWFAALELEPEVLQDDANGRVEILRRPLGVVAAITPWNFPVGLAGWKIAPALRAGNTVVLKPSPFTPLATLALGDLLRDALPPGVVNVVSGGDAVGSHMAHHPVPRKVSFTGSVGAGVAVNQAAAADLKRVTLELGGNDPAVVLDDAEPADIADGLFWGAFMNSGQACAAVKRVYVPARMHSDVVDALAAVASGVCVGDPTEDATQLGPLSTLPQFRRVSDLVTDAMRSGAVAAAGGHAIDGPGYFFEPTILAGLDNGARVVDEEQFGPVLPVIAYHDLDDAITRANATHFGLGSSVWTADPERGAEVAARLEAGMTWVNAHPVSSVEHPFLGVKDSGLGVENGIWGLRSFTDMHLISRPS
jgi:acyl-CoA reductase-like NAD-dependent aldehyde dehydrogenase